MTSGNGGQIEQSRKQEPDSENSRLGCRCAAFTSENEEFISALDLIGRYDYGKDESFRQNFIEACSSGGLDKSDVIKELDHMALTDFIICILTPLFKINSNITRMRDSIDSMLERDRIRDERITLHGKELDEVVRRVDKHEVRITNLERYHLNNNQ